MRKLLVFYLTITLLFLYIDSSAQAPNYLWAEKSGAINGITVAAVTVDSNQNIYITGFFARTVNIGGTLLDAGAGSGMFIVKYDTNGNVVWAKKAVGNDRIVSTTIAVDNAGSVYVGGSFSAASFTMNSVTLTNSTASTAFQDGFAMKFDANGTAIWGKSYGVSSGNDIVYDLIADSSGSIFVVGGRHNSVTNSRNLFVRKVTASGGGNLWFSEVSGSGFDFATDVTVDNSGNVYVTGIYESSSLTFGSTTLTNAGNYDMFVTKFASSGDVLWSKSIGNINNVVSEGIDVDSNGNLYLFGYFNSPTLTIGTTILNNIGSALSTYFVSKFDSSGNAIWAVRPNGGATTSSGANMQVDSEGNCFITGVYTTANMVFGATNLSNSGGRDIFLARYNTNGTAIWAKSIGSSVDDFAQDIALGPNGNCHVVGNFFNSLTFGVTVLNNQSSNPDNLDYFLTKLDNTTLSLPETDITNDQFKLHPNPTRDYFELSAVIAIEKVEVYNTIGQLVKSFLAQTQYNVSDLKRGRYFVKVISAQATEMKSVLIE